MLDMGVDTDGPGFVRNDGLRVYGPRGILDLPWPALNDWPGYGLVRTRLDFDELLMRRGPPGGGTPVEATQAPRAGAGRGGGGGGRGRPPPPPPGGGGGAGEG